MFSEYQSSGYRSDVIMTSLPFYVGYDKTDRPTDKPSDQPTKNNNNGVHRSNINECLYYS